MELIRATCSAKGTSLLLSNLFGQANDNLGRAKFPRLGAGHYVPLTRRWGKGASPEERSQIEAEDGTDEMLASGEIVEDEQGRRYKKFDDDV